MARFHPSKALFALLSLLALIAFPASAADKVVNWQVWVTPNMTRAFYDATAKAFEAKNPGIAVKVVEANAANDPNADNFIKLRIASGDVPDVLSNFNVKYMADAGLLWEMPANDPDLAKVKDLMAAAYNGKLYAFNDFVQPQGCMFYNKALFKKAGIKAVPKTWAEFEAVCAKLKAAGITPIITGGEWVPGYLVNHFISVNLGKNKPNWWTDRYAGKTSFAATPEVTETIAFLQNLVAKGYFNKGALSVGYSDLEQQFLSGAAAMYPMGCWFTAAESKAKKDFEVGVFAYPTKDGKINLTRTARYGTSSSIYAKSPVIPEAFKLVKFITMDPTYGVKGIEVDGLFSNLKPPLTYPMTPLQKELQDLVGKADCMSGNIEHMLGSPGAPGIFDELSKVGQVLLAGAKTSPADLAKQLDSYVDSLKQ